MANNSMVLRLAAICHDMGKPSTTLADFSANGHAEAGVPVAESFLRRIGAPAEVIAQVLPLVREHMIRGIAQWSDSAIRRLAVRLAPATIDQLAEVIRADRSRKDDGEAELLVARARALAVAAGRPAPLVLGRHVVALGVAPGVRVGELCRAAFEAQLAGTFSTTETGVEFVRSIL